MLYLQQPKQLFALILESIVYGILGSLFVSAIFLIEDFYRNQQISGFPVQVEQSIGLIWIFSALVFSSLFGNLIFRKTEKIFPLKSFFVLVLSTFLSVLMQMIFLINHSTMIENLQVYSLEDIYGTIGIRLFTKLFIALTLFIFTFEGFRFLFQNLKKRNVFN